MATLTFAGGVALEPVAFETGLWPFQGSVMSPFQGHRPIPFYVVVADPPTAFVNNIWPYNGGTISPARGGSAIIYVNPPYYWS